MKRTIQEKLGAAWMRLAGVVAEARFSRRGIFSIHPSFWEEDWDCALAAITRSPDPEGIDKEVENAFENTKQLVIENWQAVERVAAALLERGRLDGDEVRALCGPCATGLF